MKLHWFILILLSACSKLPPQPLLTWNQKVSDQKPFSIPQESDHLKFGELAQANTLSHLQMLSDLRTYGRLVGEVLWGYEGKEASNINLYDEVPDSSWFTNRNARFPFSEEEIARGPTKVRLAGDGPLVVLSGKSDGVTPGFVVKDKNENRFLLKFDPQKGCGLSSGAEVISSRFLYAAGYNVPEDNIEYIDPQRFILSPKATTKGKYRKTVPLSEEAFSTLLKSLPPCKKEGKIRTMASRFVEGKPIGPFSYQGRRTQDPNDRVFHHNRRELRGLSVMAAWLQHTDLTDYNTLDVFVRTQGELGHIVHYLIDFGGTLGAESTGPKGNNAGNEYDIDFETMTLNLLSVGIREPDWKQETPLLFESIGNFRNFDFDPEHWVPSHPHAAMTQRTFRDSFWGAKLVASFSDAQILSAVKTADFLEKGAEEEMARLLRERRDLIAKFWFSRVGALDRFEISGEIPEITFEDWERKGPWSPKPPIQYAWKLKGGNPLWGKTSEKKISLFQNVAEWNSWKEKTLEKGKTYFFLEVTSLSLTPPFKPLSPKTTAVLFLDSQKILHWVGTQRQVQKFSRM